MNPAVPTAPSTITAPVIADDFVADLLVKKKLTKVAVIDDAFDPLCQDDVENDKFRDFLIEHIGKQEFNDFLNDLEISTISDNDIDEDVKVFEYLKIIWDNRAKSNQFEQLLFGVFSKKITKTKDLQSIRCNLQKMGLTVECFGSAVTREELGQNENKVFDIVFIDYFLGSIEDESAIENAVEKIKDVHDCCPNDRKPVTILMSSKSGLDDGKADTFRKNADLLGGVFRFSTKAELKNEYIFSLILGALAREFVNSHQIKSYVHALCNAADDALNKFKTNINNLNVEDYVFIQNMGLQSEEQPLGDYVAWLYGAYWEQLLFTNKKLVNEQKKLNAMFDSDFPIMYGTPSKVFSRIYMTALFEEPGPLTVRKRPKPKPKKGALEVISAVESTPDEDSAVEIQKRLKNLHVSLGDILIDSEGNKPLMVINAQCDLERSIEPDFSIFLISGKLVPWGQDAPKDVTTVRTEFFLHKEKSYRIVWNFDEVQTKPFKRLFSWLNESGYERKYRLKLPFALDIQRTFTTRLTRIGLPVPPPLTESITIEVWAPDANGDPKVIIESSSDYAFRVGSRQENNGLEHKMVFNFNLGHDLKLALWGIETISKFGDMEEKQQREHGIWTVIKNFDKWFLTFNNNPPIVPNDVIPKHSGSNVYLAANWNPDGPKPDWKKTGIIINVIA